MAICSEHWAALFSEFTFLRPYDPAFRCFVKQMFLTGVKKKRSKFFFSWKKPYQWWIEHSYCTRSPLLTYTINECFSARCSFSRSVPTYSHLYATVLHIPKAYMHTLWYWNSFIMIIPEMTYMRTIVRLITLIPWTMFSSFQRARLSSLSESELLLICATA